MTSLMSQLSPSATNQIRLDHTHVLTAFRQYEVGSPARLKKGLADNVCLAIEIHAQLEEEIFYPALRGKVEDDDLDEAYVEHDGAKVLINEIEAGSASDDFYDAKVKVLKEEIEHHVKEEERQADSMFSQARKADVDLVALGEQLAQRKQELQQQIEQQGLPPIQTRTLEQAQI